jgi:hypothetical protein
LAQVLRRHFRPGRIAALISLLLPALAAFGQAPLSDLIFTVGTTFRAANAQDTSYVLLGAADPALLRGKRFAVFGKAGDAASGATFTRRGDAFQQTDRNAINTLLNQSVALGQNLPGLAQTLDGVLRHSPGITNQSLPEKVLTLFQAAATNQPTDSILRLLTLNHPGLKLALGQAFSEPITGITTYEVRELSPVTGAVGDVVGRVTIAAGAPVILPAPGQPFQLVTNHPSDHLVCYDISPQPFTTTVTTPVIYALGTVTTVVSFAVMALTLGVVWLWRRRRGG